MKKFISWFINLPLKIKDNFISFIKSYLKLTLIQKLIFINSSILLLIILLVLFNISKWLILVPIGLFIFISIRIYLNNIWWQKKYNENIFIFGGKGKGKDLSMQAGVYLNRKSSQVLSNLDYGYNSILLENLAELMDIGNTFEDLINNTVKLIPKNKYFEGKRLNISDASIYFPSHEDTALKKRYASFPLFYAISRHLFNMTIVVNTQVNGRLWKSLREQVQDGYIEALGVIGWGYIWNSIPIIRNYVGIKLRYYEKEQSAVMGLLPFKKVAILNKGLDNLYLTSGGATKEQYEATNGVIKELIVVLNKKHIKYDSRHFHKVFFGYESEDK